ncbi:WW domain-containing protein wwm1 [Exophiala xenobiotica]|uniref:WW domain-containing protein wwm1 n=1 Tax=Lithohypha guttulata TaxID=1690604 RepID=A0ABR0K4D9_9EURO|nr:WW domain-containing protein wwm1 [Lithohypha guttulata]KAK5309331.1 WW domain-containing protein wwm1 [Exophiala xenobiotica]
MSDFAPPTGPPPPQVPEGWKAVWNDQYQEYFYVNLYTKQSTWERPTVPASAGGDMPPSYTSGGHAPLSDTKGHMGSNNPYNTESDEAMARRMQEDERAHGSNHGANNNYYGSGPTPQHGGYSGAPEYAQHETGADRGHKSGGLMGKLKDKLQSSGAGGHHGAGYPQQGYGGHHGGYPAQPMGYGGHHGQPMMGGMGGGMYGQPMRQKRGMGAGRGAALGLGGGLLGGMMLGNAMDGDMGGDDMGGGSDMSDGDMGGDMGDMGDMGGD